MNHATRRTVAAVLCAALLAPFIASAQDEAESPFSWNVTGVSDYVFRGVSQTDEDPTVQASFTYTSPVGLYAGIWGSGVDFGNGGPDAEVDYLIGYGVDVTDNVNFDVMLNYYSYPGSSELAYAELITKTSFAEHYNVTVAYTNDVLNTDTDGWYFAAGTEWTLPQDVVLSANVGRNTFKDEIAKDYTDWNIGVNRTWGLFTLGLGYYGTDGNGRDNSGKLADNRVVFSVAVGQ